MIMINTIKMKLMIILIIFISSLYYPNKIIDMNAVSIN